jgi:hypothetical protein
MSRREGEGRPRPDPPKRDDAGNPLPSDPPHPGAPTAAGEAAGDDRGAPQSSDDGGGSEVM